ncbi:Zinc dependent phospholipase C [Acetanaerobacterium elongatum]|uniref:Zinc dependent phospholipase C n=2 Tax=Acetanaerobacterium elongatum TaxID=258515 RepID=A0A1H0F508_9FIRM|nr:Zinc dependent phospholipase C [Acetanaerobacterium elongatum]
MLFGYKTVIMNANRSIKGVHPMNLNSHLKMASKVMNLYIREQRFTERLAFLFGNIQPDIIGSFMFVPHSAQARGAAFEKRIKNCIDSIENARHGGVYTNIKLGILCHFLADFFCYAHNGGIPSSREHIGYEMAITKCLKAQSPIGAAVMLPSQRADKILENIWAAYEEYRSIPSTPERDIAYAVSLCAYLFGSADSIARESRFAGMLEPAAALS